MATSLSEISAEALADASLVSRSSTIPVVAFLDYVVFCHSGYNWTGSAGVLQRDSQANPAAWQLLAFLPAAGFGPDERRRHGRY